MVWGLTVSHGVCQMVFVVPGGRGSGSARTLCGHGRSASAQLLLPISQQAPQSHPHSSCAAADGGELAVCFSAFSWRGSCEGAQAFGPTRHQNRTAWKFGWCAKLVSRGGMARWGVRWFIPSERILWSRLRDPAQLEMQREAVLSRELHQWTATKQH